MKLLTTVLMVGLLFAVNGRGMAQAVVEGTVKLPPAHSADVLSKRYELTGETALIAPDPPAAVVYLEGTFPLKTNPPHAQMAQKNIDFVPRLLPIQVGTTVEFPNLDDTYHNVFSFSKPKRFDLGRYRRDELPVPTEVFDKPGPVVLHCDIHETMRAIILVLETPYFRKTDPDGHYRLVNLPAGHYKLKAWLDSKTTREQEIDLKSGSTLHVDFP